MKEFRCKKCHKLLFKADKECMKIGTVTIETKCTKCKENNIFMIQIAVIESK